MKNVQSGTLEYTTPKEEEILKKFEEIMAPHLQDLPQLRTKWSMLRFLRARQFNLKNAVTMMNNYLEFRRKHPHDVIAATPISEFQAIYDNYASGYCHSDNDGNLIVIEEVAKSRPDAVLEQKSEEEVINFLIQRFERMVYVVMPFLSALHGKRVERTCLIVDLKNVKTSLFFNKKVREFLGICAKMGQDYYPETLGKCFIINAPMLFSGVWSVLKLMLDQRTVSKIFIESNSAKELLAKHIDVKKLPPILGGTNTHPINELNGPWKDELLDAYQRKSFFLRDRTPEFQYFWLPHEREKYMPNAIKQEQAAITANTQEYLGVPEKSGLSQVRSQAYLEAVSNPPETFVYNQNNVTASKTEIGSIKFPKLPARSCSRPRPNIVRKVPISKFTVRMGSSRGINVGGGAI